MFHRNIRPIMDCFDYSLHMAGNNNGYVWGVRYSDKMAHAYKNKYDGYVDNSQFRERCNVWLIGK